MKISISYPPIPEAKGTPMLGQNRQFQYFHNPSYIYPMVPAYAATLLKQEGYEVIWDDCIATGKTYEDFLDSFRQNKPDVIALETKTPVVKKHWAIIDELKSISAGTLVVLMGDHITALPEESMENSKADYCLTGGDYDFMLLNICRHLEGTQELEEGVWYRKEGEIKNTGAFKLNHDLDKLPRIDRELTQWKNYGERLYKGTPFTYTMAGRDCPWARCTFCSWTTIYPKFRTRSPQSMLDEIGFLIDNYGVREVFDDTGTFPSGKWLKEFCQGMIERGYNKKIYISCNFRFDYLTKERAEMMKEAGFRLMKLGLESANNETLERLDKGVTVEGIRKGAKIAKAAGLDVHLTIMVGYPWETKQDALNTLNLARELMLGGYADMLQSTVVTAYPGTPLYKEGLEHSWFRIDPRDYDKFDMGDPVFKTPDMQPQEVMHLCDKIYKIFLHPKFIFNHLRKIRFLEDITYLARGVKPVLGHIRDFMKIR